VGRRDESTALIVCIGNDLAADDGVGHAIYHALVKQELPAGTRLRLLGDGGLDLLEEMEGEDHLVVVDAVQFGAAPGTLHVLDWEQLPSGGTQPVSGHGIGIREAIEVGRCLYPEKIPRHIHLVGIEGKCFDRFRAYLSIEVAGAVEAAVAKVLHLLQ
jgi:hydrogenase maturation protease